MLHSKILIKLASIMFAMFIVGSCDEKDELYDETPADWTLSVRKIWDGAAHSAFTDLVRFNDAFYCVFREADDHFAVGGRVRLLKSTDGVDWETVKVFELAPEETGGGTPDDPQDLEFNGVNQNMVISHHPDFDFTNDQSFSITALVNLKASSAISNIVSTRNGGNGYDFIYQNNQIKLDITNPYLQYWQNRGTVTSGTWHQIGFVYDGTAKTVTLYQNGAVSNANPYAPGSYPRVVTTQANTYGNDIVVFSRTPNHQTDPTNYFAYLGGKISYLRFWNKALTSSEMSADEDGEITASTSGLIAGYDFSNIVELGSDLIVPDIKGKHPGKLRNFNPDQFGEPGSDLRDPKLLITPDNRLMILMDGERYLGSTRLNWRPYVSFSDTNGDNFSEPERADIHFPTADGLSNGNFWIWDLAWNNAKTAAYGFDYVGSQPLTLFRTTDGKVFRREGRITLDGTPNEVAVQFDKQDNMYALIRREAGTALGVLAVSPPPYDNFTYNQLDFRLGGPNFLFLDDETLVIGTRGYDNTTTMHIVVTDLKGEVLKKIPLSSLGDASYPGMVIHDGYLWVSYYSSKSGKADIYMAKIPLEDLKP